MTGRELLKAMGRAEESVHGFRSSFRDWAAERTSFPTEIAESAGAQCRLGGAARLPAQRPVRETPSAGAGLGEIYHSTPDRWGSGTALRRQNGGLISQGRLGNLERTGSRLGRLIRHCGGGPRDRPNPAGSPNGRGAVGRQQRAGAPTPGASLEAWTIRSGRCAA
jgi:hypothetical protein